MSPRAKILSFLAVAALLAVPRTSSAQTGTTGTTTVQAGVGRIQLSSGQATVTFNQADCQSDRTFGVTVDFPSGLTGTGAFQVSTFTVFLSDTGSCPDTAAAIKAAGDKVVVLQQETTASTTPVPITIRLQQIVGSTCPPNETTTTLVCTSSKIVNSAGTASFQKTSISVVYDSKPPNPPTLSDNTTGGEGTVYLNWTADEDAKIWRFHYRTDGPPPPTTIDRCGKSTSSSALTGGTCTGPLDCQPASDAGLVASCQFDDAGNGTCIETAAPAVTDAGTPAPSDAGIDAGTDAGIDAGPQINPADFPGIFEISNAAARSGAVTGLVNNQRYAFYLTSIDTADNESTPSNVVFGTPVAVNDFFQQYQCQGGQEKGGFGCTTGGAAALLPALAALGLGLLRRGRRS